MMMCNVTDDLNTFVEKIALAAHLPRVKRGTLNVITIHGDAKKLSSQSLENRHQFFSSFVSEISEKDNKYQREWKYRNYGIHDEIFDRDSIVKSNLLYIQDRVKSVYPQLNSYFEDEKLVVDSVFNRLRDVLA